MVKYNRIITSDEREPLLKEISFSVSTIETIDWAFYNWLNDLNIHVETNKGFKEVPILWAGQSRAYHMKNDHRIRDENGKLILPIMTIERKSLAKRMNKKGTVYAGLDSVNDEKGGVITIARQIQQDKTANFANADSQKSMIRQPNFPRENKKIVYQTVSIPIPIYLDIVYEININTEYQQQMNDILAKIGTFAGGLNYFTISHENHRYEAFMGEEWSLDNNIATIGEEERKYSTKISTNVLGYIISADKNQDSPKIVIRENAVEIKIPREHVIFGDVLDHIDKRGQYIE